MSVLLPDEIRRGLPKLYDTENIKDPLVQAKFFTPWTQWTWYLIEFDGEDRCFGLVDGFEVELGYFSLGELAAIVTPSGIGVERDEYFTPKLLSCVRQEIEQRRNPLGHHGRGRSR